MDCNNPNVKKKHWLRSNVKGDKCSKASIVWEIDLGLYMLPGLYGRRPVTYPI
jgi:hypothetical protein